VSHDITLDDLDDCTQGLRGSLRYARGIAQLAANQDVNSLHLLEEKEGLTYAMDALIAYLDKAEAMVDTYLDQQHALRRAPQSQAGGEPCAP
jgi:hypothetical protein